MAIDEIQARLARLEVERDAAIERRDYWQGEATKIRNHVFEFERAIDGAYPGRGTNEAMADYVLRLLANKGAT